MVLLLLLSLLGLFWLALGAYWFAQGTGVLATTLAGLLGAGMLTGAAIVYIYRRRA